MNRFRLLASFLLASITCVAFAAEHPSGGNEHPSSKKAADTRPVGILFHADWCPSCKVLEPKLDALKPEFEKTIRFVQMDLTNEATTAESARLADELGLSKVLAAHQGKTGFMLLVDPTSGRTLQTLTSAMETDSLRAGLTAARDGVAKSEHPKSEHPKSEQPKSEHPKSEHPKSETPKSEHPSSEHPTQS